MIFTEIFMFKLPLVVALAEFVCRFPRQQATRRRVKLHRFPEFYLDFNVWSKITVSRASI